MGNVLKDIGMLYLKQQAKPPAADLPAILEDTAQYTEDGQPLTADQYHAAISAGIDYAAGRIQKQLKPQKKK